MSKSSFPIPVPNAEIIIPILSEDITLSNLDFSVLRILPNTGRIAWYFLSLPVFAEPAAESPSTK